MKLKITALLLAIGATSASAQLTMDPMRMAAAAQNPYSMLDGMFNRQFDWAERAWPILKANTQHCPKDVAHQAGFGVFPIGIQARKDRKQIVKNGGKLGVRVFRVFADSPALEAGLQKDDVITAVNGEEVDTGKNAPDKYYDQFADVAKSGEPVRLSIFRDGRDIDVVVTTVPVCNYRMSLLAETGQITMAGTHGELQLNPVFLSAAETDNEKTVLLAHEIAHHMSGHVKAKSALSKVGGVLDKAVGLAGVPTFGGLGAAGGMVTRGGDEKEADALSIELLKSVGISVIEAVDLWERIYEDTGGTYRRLTSSHPMSDKRHVALVELAAPERARLETEATARQAEADLATATATEQGQAAESSSADALPAEQSSVDHDASVHTTNQDTPDVGT